MEDEYEVSVIVATYNPNMVKLYNTINSILCQNGCKFEIIVVDDGSKNFDIKSIEEFFKNECFSAYKIVPNKVNGGILKNFMSGMKVAKGKYVKFISPGDYLYNENILKDCLDFLILNDYKMCFGKSVYYMQNDNGSYKYINKSNPMNLKIYEKKCSRNKILKNYLYYQDYILGAATVCEKKIMDDYFEKIVDKIIFLEDLTYALMLSDNVRMGFFNKYMIWYECNTGISNTIDLNFQKNIDNDMIILNEMIIQNHPDLKKYCKEHCGKKLGFIFRVKRKIRKEILKLEKVIFNSDYKKIDCKNLENMIKNRE